MKANLNLECDRCGNVDRNVLVESGSETDRLCYRVSAEGKTCGGYLETLWDDGAPAWSMK